MEKTLKLIFKDELEKNRTLAIKGPKDNLKAGEVRPIMKQLITDDVFLNGSSKLKAVGGMRIAYEEDVPE